MNPLFYFILFIFLKKRFRWPYSKFKHERKEKIRQIFDN